MPGSSAEHTDSCCASASNFLHQVVGQLQGDSHEALQKDLESNTGGCHNDKTVVFRNGNRRGHFGLMRHVDSSRKTKRLNEISKLLDRESLLTSRLVMDHGNGFLRESEEYVEIEAVGSFPNIENFSHGPCIYTTLPCFPNQCF